MKSKMLLTLLLAAVSGTAVFAAEKAPERPSAYKDYQDWQFRAVTVSDAENRGNNVRNQMDFTVPMHGPWLLNPAYDSVTIKWITRVPCGAALEYREKGTEEFTRIWIKSYGQIDFSKDLHTHHLTGLKPATEYEYRFVTATDEYFGAHVYGFPVVGREIYSFKTLDPKKDTYKVFITADFHGGARLILDPMMRNTKAADSDFFCFLGDNVEDSMNHARYHTTFGFLNDMSRHWSTSKPTVFVRGNHDYWGRESIQWGEYFGHTSGKSYYAFEQGQVLYVVLDTMNQSGGTKLKTEMIDEYMKEQAEWLKALKKTDMWKKAKFRIVLAHFGTLIDGTTAGWTYSYFGDILNDVKDGRVHAYLCGHEHRYSRIDMGSTEVKGSLLDKYRPSRYAVEKPQNYTQVSCHVSEGMTLEVFPDKLLFKSFDWRHDDGKLYDMFEIYPDGKVKDLMETQLIPVQPPKAKKK